MSHFESEKNLSDHFEEDEFNFEYRGPDVNETTSDLSDEQNYFEKTFNSMIKRG